MVTKEQAASNRTFHYGHCTRTIGPRGGIKENVQAVRANGRLQTWKTRPAEFRLPVKIGLRGYDYIDHRNCQDFHTENECPLNHTTGEVQ